MTRKTPEEIDRLILERLLKEKLPETEQELADEIDVNRNSVSKHLRDLEVAGLIYGKSIARLRDVSTEAKSVILIKIDDGMNKMMKLREIENVISGDAGLIKLFLCGGNSDCVVISSRSLNTFEFATLLEKIYSVDGVSTSTLSEIPRNKTSN